MARPRRARHWVLPAWSLLLGLLMLAPTFRPGYVVSYDMVFVPDLRLTPASFGLTSAQPRAVPQDAVVAVLDNIVPGAMLQRMILLSTVVLAAWGAGRLFHGGPLGARLVAASVYGWSAFVAERLVQGHWSLLIAYAALPWLVRMLGDVRTATGWDAVVVGSRVVLLVAVSALTPTGGVLAAALVLVVLAVPGGRSRRWVRVLVAVGAVVVQLPWVVPGILHPGGGRADALGAEVFAARSDTPLGLVGSVLSLGGIWNSAVVPPSRGLVSTAILLGAMLVVAAVGVFTLPDVVGRAVTLGLGVMAMAGVVIAVAPSAGPLADLAGLVVSNLPGGGLLRDSQKYVAWIAPVLALGTAAGAGRVARWFAGRVPEALVYGVVALLPLAALPDLAWGAGGRLVPSQYPDEWRAARRALEDVRPPGDLIVLPFQTFRRYEWTDDTVVLDPAPRYLGWPAVLPDVLTVGDVTVPGDDPGARRVSEALDAPDPAAALAAIGVGAVAVDRDAGGVLPGAAWPGGTRPEPIGSWEAVAVTGTLDVYRVPGDVTDAPQPITPAPVMVAWILAGGVVLPAAILAGSRGWRKAYWLVSSTAS